MDRGFRHRALLSAAIAGGTLLAGGLRAQSPTPAPSATVAATPWVQAVPPPRASPAKPANPPAKAQSPSPIPTPSVAATASPTPREDLARAMARKREEELAREKAASGKPTPPLHDGAQLSPEERDAYARNLNLWQTMPPEEKQTIRSLAAEGMQEEIRKAYESSGLTLNEDQKEVFALRYKQERRRLERDIQQKAKAERTRRLPEIMDRLKHEFPSAASPSPTK